ncbi:unnamed protein product [Dibothriocephalus latus]|uniref:Methionyl/Leucyl tRNA synthetase domain-containing protein n=1 Tax=Dibothriocephalus latus TaxID=60516 RepID=A0A3P7PR56_DIBLA|nr:unnamed protein product [Dibothriocephalus latus]
MSKSLGNVLSPSAVIEHFSARMQNASDAGRTYEDSKLRPIAADCLRYCLVRSVCLNEDFTFNLAHAERTVNAELVNPLGNLLSRRRHFTVRLAADENFQERKSSFVDLTKSDSVALCSG